MPENNGSDFNEAMLGQMAEMSRNMRTMAEAIERLSAQNGGKPEDDSSASTAGIMTTGPASESFLGNFFSKRSGSADKGFIRVRFKGRIKGEANIEEVDVSINLQTFFFKVIPTLLGLANKGMALNLEAIRGYKEGTFPDIAQRYYRKLKAKFRRATAGDKKS